MTVTATAGPLRHRIAIQRQTDTITTSGGFAPTWATIATVWASVEPLSGREYLREHAVHGDTTHRVRMRYRGGVTRRHRLLWGARVFDILDPANQDEANVLLVILVKERDA